MQMGDIKNACLCADCDTIVSAMAELGSEIDASRDLSVDGGAIEVSNLARHQMDMIGINTWLGHCRVWV